MNSAATSSITKPAPPRSRWWVACLLFVPIFLVAVILTLVCMHFLANLATNRAWAEAEAEADAAEPRWRLADLEADREKIPDAENSALRIIAITAKARDFRVDAARNYAHIFDLLRPSLEMNEQQLRLIRDELGKIPEPLAEARKLKDMPRGRFPIAYSDDFLGTIVAEQQYARLLGDWLMHDAYLLAHDKEYDRAVESCRALVNVGRALGDEPLVISYLIRVAMHMTAMEALERVLAQGQASDEQLGLMQALLQREVDNGHFLQGVRGERAGIRETMTCIRDGKLHFDEISTASEKRRDGFAIGDWFADTKGLSHYPDHLRRMNRCVEIIRLPIHQRGPELEAWQDDAKASKNLITNLFAGSMVKMHQAECRSQAMLRSTVAALACERYRLRHRQNAWPASLEVLVKDRLLDTIPVDPMDNKQIRYRPTAVGIVVYSIGIDLADNQGRIDRARPQEPGVDVGFRLWNVSERRQPPLPAVVIPEEK